MSATSTPPNKIVTDDLALQYAVAAIGRGDLASGKQKEILTHLHAAALAVSPDGAFVVCANAASDNLSVIQTSNDKVVETIWAKPKPSELVGAMREAISQKYRDTPP